MIARMRRLIPVIVVTLLATLTTTACGLKGPLYLPDQAQKKPAEKPAGAARATSDPVAADPAKPANPTNAPAAK
jgi:predicted small lipoprotein YifL